MAPSAGSSASPSEPRHTATEDRKRLDAAGRLSCFFPRAFRSPKGPTEVSFQPPSSPPRGSTRPSARSAQPYAPGTRAEMACSCGSQPGAYSSARLGVLMRSVASFIRRRPVEHHNALCKPEVTYLSELHQTRVTRSSVGEQLGTEQDPPWPRSRSQARADRGLRTHHKLTTRPSRGGHWSTETACSGHGASRTRTGDLLGAILGRCGLQGKQWDGLAILKPSWSR
jgi:hypothetical protein